LVSDMLQTVREARRRETRADAFKRLASQRTNGVLERLRILGNCANRQLYEYSDEDVRKIFSTIEKEVRGTKAKFMNSRKPDFSL
jgi:hypothetical protein